jgi:lipoprotein-anchoring transpeptidase ErfK/SrfK
VAPSSRRKSRVKARLTLALLALSVAAPGARADPPAAFPAAGGINWSAIAVRSAPSADAPRIGVLQEFRSDYRHQVVFALGQRVGEDGRLWYRVLLSRRPNGTTGWVRADGVDVRPVTTTIVVHRAKRSLEVVRNGETIFRTTVAVGAPGTETPRGRFYLTTEFRPTDSFYGTWAFETSAYSPTLTDWPGGGKIGIHGTSAPGLLGQAVSHGCIRVSNAAANRLHALVSPGTALEIVG